MASTVSKIQDSPQAGVLTIGELTRTIARNKGVFWSTLIIGLMIGVGVSLLMPKSYAALTEVLIEGPSPNGVNATPDNILEGLTVPGSSYSMATQLELLQSQDIFFKVLEASNIPQPRTLADLEDLPKITIRQKKDSNVYIVVAEGANDEQAATVAGNYPQVFADYLNGLKQERVQRGVQFLDTRIGEEQAALSQAEGDYAGFKQQNNVVDSNSELQYRLNTAATLEQSLADAESREAAALAAQTQIESELAQTPRERTRILVQQNNDELLRNRATLAALEVQREQLTTRYLADAPQVKEIDNQIAAQKKQISDMEKQINSEFKESNPEYDAFVRRLSEAKAERSASAQRAQSLSQLVAERQGRVNALAGLSAQQSDIERRILTHRESLATLNQFRDRFRLRDNEMRSPVNSLTQVSFPQQTRPNWLINMILAGLLSFALAVIFALTRDSLQDKVNSVEDAYALSHSDVLARIPERPGSRNALITDPQTAVAFESYRVLRSVIGFLSDDKPIKSLLLTSTKKGEGKTVVISNLAVAFALNGQKTILVDTNFRNPSTHTLFGKQPQPGIGDVLLGNASVDDVIQETSVPNLLVISAGTTPANAVEALGSPRMKALIKDLENRGDMVLFDTCPTLGLADTPSLAPNVDAAALVMHLGKSSKAEFADAVGLLRAASPRFVGIVHNRLKVKQARLDNA